MNDKFFNPISFELPKNQSSSIKVIGVGGGGSNAVNYMYSQEIGGVDFVICNTDAQALDNSPIPIKIQLGAGLTEGMGAGANPEIGAKAAQESYNEIKEVLSTGTKMVFITAGMGGGTGTGAAPIIARLAKELSLLTVGIVTLPFEFEGKQRIQQAQRGIEKLRENVDALIVINNNKLREVYGDLGYKSGFSKADEVLTTAARGIAEVITHHYKQNIDLNDAKTVLSNSGSAIMGSAFANGDGRAKRAIESALDSPLLNDNKITGAKNVLLLIVSGTKEITIDEIGEINDHVRNEAGSDVNIILGIGDDEGLKDAISVTIIATGFSTGQQHQFTNTEVKKIVHSLEDNQQLLFDFNDNQTLVKKELDFIIEDDKDDDGPLVIHTLEDDLDTILPKNIGDIEVLFEAVNPEFIDDFKIIAKPSDSIDDTINVNSKNENPLAEEVDDYFIHFIEEKNNIAAPKQMEIPFDIEPTKKEEILAVTPNIEEINVKDAVFFDQEEQKDVIFNLSDFEEVAPTVQVANAPKKEKVVDLELQFEFKSHVDVLKHEFVKKVENTNDNEGLSPLNISIEEFRKTKEMRINTMKQHNYSFQKGSANIEKYENEPAYKRMNIELNDHPESSENAKSRTSVDFDENGIVLRRNNSFLHDNVD